MRISLAMGGSLMVAALMGAAIGEDFKSGLQEGDSAPAFNVRNITGQNAALDYAKDDRGTLCYR
jgi:hypothetical protein